MRKFLICGVALLASLAWSQQPASEASMKINKGSVEQNGNISFSVKVQPAPSTQSTVQVIVYPASGGNGYKSLCILEANADSCDVQMHIPQDAKTGTYKVAAVQVAPMSGTYKNLSVNSEALSFDVQQASTTMPTTAEVAIKH